MFSMVWRWVPVLDSPADDGHGSPCLSVQSAVIRECRPQVQDGGRPVSDDPAITLDSFLSGWLILPLPPPPDAGQTRSAATGIFNYNNLRPFGPVKSPSSARRARLQEIITCSSCWLGNEWVNRSKDKDWRWRDSADRTETHL